MNINEVSDYIEGEVQSHKFNLGQSPSQSGKQYSLGAIAALRALRDLIETDGKP